MAVDEITNETVAEWFRRFAGDVRTATWMDQIASRDVTAALKWLDHIGVTECGGRGRARKLLVSYDEALRMIEATPFRLVYRSRKIRRRRRSSRIRRYFVVRRDPTRFFRMGATFSALSVWGPDGKDLPEPGEWPVGTVLEYVDEDGGDRALYRIDVSGQMVRVEAS
jgi:hypothetical protein